jgi:hypothetical protein
MDHYLLMGGSAFEKPRTGIYPNAKPVKTMWCFSSVGGLLASILLVGACSPERSADHYEDAGGGAAQTVDGNNQRSRVQVEDADALNERAADDLEGSTYSDLGEPYGCTQDCSGHEAGVAWAQEQLITDPDECGGKSQSFMEGCQAYAEAVQERVEELRVE